MAHEMTQHDTAMYRSNTPAWHGLGTVIQGQPNSADAIRLAGLGWQVVKERAFAAVEAADGDLASQGAGLTGGAIVAPDVFVVARDDLPRTNPARNLGSVGAMYKPIQNAVAFRIAGQTVSERPE